MSMRDRIATVCMPAGARLSVFATDLLKSIVFLPNGDIHCLLDELADPVQPR